MVKGWNRDSAIWIGRRFNKSTSVGRPLRSVASTFRHGCCDRTVSPRSAAGDLRLQANRGDALGLPAAGPQLRVEFADDVGGVHGGPPRVPQRVPLMEPEGNVPAFLAVSRVHTPEMTVCATRSWLRFRPTKPDGRRGGRILGADPLSGRNCLLAALATVLHISSASSSPTSPPPPSSASTAMSTTTSGGLARHRLR